MHYSSTYVTRVPPASDNLPYLCAYGIREIQHPRSYIVHPCICIVQVPLACECMNYSSIWSILAPRVSVIL
jgi:hypothetical protein